MKKHAKADVERTIDHRPLNSDQLGEKGEAEFSRLCADVGLTCNPVKRDRTGWDFLVEFPFGDPATVAFLDGRSQPPECRVQVKSVWHGNNHVRLRLSSAERLAKHVQPACIFIFEIGNDLLIKGIKALHVRDDILSAILREIRACQKQDSTLINKKEVRLSLKVGVDIENSGKAVRDYLTEISGPDPVQYVREKERQLNDLGVIGSRFSGRFEMEVSTESEFLDVMLGIKPVAITNFSAHETRWNIKLPVSGSLSAGTATILPKPLRGRISFKSAKSGDLVFIDVDVYLPAALPPNYGGGFRFRAVGSRITVDAGYQGREGSLDFEYDLNGPVRLKEVEDVFRCSEMVLKDGGAFRLSIKGKTALNIPFEPAQLSDGPDFESASLEVIKSLKQVLRAAGESWNEFTLKIDELRENWRAITVVQRLLSEPAIMMIGPAIVSLPPDIVEQSNKAEILAIGRIPFASSHIAFCTIGTAAFSGGIATQVSMQIDNLSLRHIEVIEPTEGAFDSFQVENRLRSGVNLCLVWHNLNLSRENAKA